MNELVAQYLERLRLRLLDLSLRNRLLNFKFSERSRTQVRVVDTLPDRVFKQLEEGGRLKLASLPEPPEHPTDEDDDGFRLLLEAMRDTDTEYIAAVAALDEVDRDSQDFQKIERQLRDKVRAELALPPRTNVQTLSKADYAKSLGMNPDYDLPTDNGNPAHRNNKLPTLLYPDELERKLAGLREGARKSIQETGLNTLYLAFGMLEWYESDQSDKRLLAPLLLYPVKLDRKLRSGRYEYTITSFDEGFEVNSSLKEKLKKDFGIELPDFLSEEGKPSDTPESYFKKVQAIIPDRSRWRVRRFLTLGLFSFGRIALYRDLDPARWSNGTSILDHPLISTILCGQEEVSQNAIAPDYEVDRPEIADKVPLLITDADASQFSAIVDAMDGRNLVIEGPPGTGKSQTITNLIAAAIAKGKKVLFVAEKKAALEVVYNRLAKAGLENYCLEAHATSISRKSFYEHLKIRVEQEPPSDVSGLLQEKVREYSQLRQSLSRYAQLLNQPLGRTGISIQELFWADLQAGERISHLALPSELKVLQDDKAATMTAADVERKCQHLLEFRQRDRELRQNHRTVENHPWFGVTRDLSPVEQDDLRVHAKMWLQALQRLHSQWLQIAETLRLPREKTLLEIFQVQQQLASCPEPNSLTVLALLPVLNTPQVCDAISSLIHQIKTFRTDKQALLQFFQQGIASLEATRFGHLFGAAHGSTLDFDRVAATVKDLRTQVPELCNPSQRSRLEQARDTSDSLQSERAELERNYNLGACRDSQRMAFYASKLRQANFLSPLFDSDYREAQKLWREIEKFSTRRTNSEIATIFERIARFQERLQSFQDDFALRRTCGQFFNGLETDFQGLIVASSFACELVQRLEKIATERQRITALKAANILDRFYQEENTDIERLEATINFARAILQSQLPPPIRENLFTKNAYGILAAIQNASRSLSDSHTEETKHRQAFLDLGKIDSQAMFGSKELANLEIKQITERIQRALAVEGDLPAWISYQRAYQQVVNDGLKVLIESFEREQLAFDDLEVIYRFVFYRSLLRFAYQQYPELKQLSGVTQAQDRERFQRADRELLDLNQQQLVSQLAQVYIEPGNNNVPASEKTELALIQHETNKQKRHISLRDLFRRASIALQQLKPCWMMSPASVAQFIPPGAVTFDMVIIDEASQMRPEEALGAIARSQQLVVVGDPKQLPPTDFFRANFEQDDEDFEEEADGSDILDNESILDMSIKVFYPARRLKWHYRSRHESLIAFSNQHFYDNSLTVFPSPNCQFAVEYQYVEAGSYRSGVNVPEALWVAEAATEFMRKYPNLSLGIVTLNQKQQELLLDEMDRLFARDPELEKYRAAQESTLEPFFVKNLENVQGDERDVIFISTVYGPEKPGMPVMQRFGPINSQNGHRRLNVLFTRAKERVVIFSSMRSSDIRTNLNSNLGVHVLKDYLEYAQTQRLQTAVITGREPDSDFEIFVAERLRQHGYEVVPQVGVSGYFIDLAIIDPRQPSAYLLGVECDGATYHSSKAARDRDRLRQQVLERLGWQLYRVWSTDWFSNPNAEMQKLLNHIQALVAPLR